MSLSGPSTPGFTRQTTRASTIGQISLTDNTKPQHYIEEEQLWADDGSYGGNAPLSKSSTSQRVGPTRLRQHMARRKYAKYQQGRYVDDEDDNDNPDAENNGQSGNNNSSVGREDDQQPSPTTPTADSTFRRAPTARSSTFRRGRDKVKSILSRKKASISKEGDVEVDVLIENQRGTYFFGKPYYSSQSLLNFDYAPWTAEDGKPSPVDVTNAQVPDPNWEWAWRTWYVDMARDVDEQGWQYSFMFPPRFPWHGSHPFFLSFVRRRRWIRLRVRKHRNAPNPATQGARTASEAHKLNADYFTIHPSRTKSLDSSKAASTQQTSLRDKRGLDDVADDDDGDIDNIKALFTRLRKATVDRERIAAVLKYMDQGGQDIHYLADEVPHIMNLLVFEHSRQRLVAEMLKKVDDLVPEHRPEGKSDKNKSQNKGQEQVSAQKKEDLLKAVRAADDAVKRLEYWSDIKYTVHHAETISASDTSRGWEAGKWQGLDLSGPEQAKDDVASFAQSSKSPDTDKGKAKAASTSPPASPLTIGIPSYHRSLFPPAFSPTSSYKTSESRPASEPFDREEVD